MTSISVPARTGSADVSVSVPANGPAEIEYNIQLQLATADLGNVTDADLIARLLDVSVLNALATALLGATASPLTITGTPPADATIGEPYSFTPLVLHASGAVSFSLTGTLPAGLSFNASTGTVSGTPTAATTATALNITVTDAAGATDSLDSFFVIVVSPTVDASRPSIIPGGWQQNSRRVYTSLNAISLNHGQSEATIASDTGEYKMGTSRYREGGQLGGTYSEVGVEGFGHDVFIDGLAHSLLPAEYVIARPLGEVEPIPGVGIRLHSRPSTGAEMTALLAAQFGDVRGAAAAGTTVKCSGLLTTYINGAITPPAARLTRFRAYFDYTNHAFLAAQWSTENGNRAWPNDTLHKPFEYDDQEFLGWGASGLGHSVSIHAFNGATAIDTRLGEWEPGSVIGVDVWVCTVMLTDRIATHYSLDGVAWTKVTELLASDMRTGSIIAEYIQAHTTFMHNISSDHPWLGAAGVASVPVYFDLKETAVYAPASNTLVTGFELDPPAEVTLTWRSTYGTSIPEDIAVGTTVFDLTFPTGVTSANAITYGGRLEITGTEGKIAGTGLDYETQPVLRFHIEGVKANGAKSIGRLYQTTVTDVFEADWWVSTDDFQADWAGNRAFINGTGTVALSAIHDTNNAATTAAKAKLNQGAFVAIFRGSNNPNKDGILGNELNRYLAFYFGDETPKKISIKTNDAGTPDEAFAAIVGMTTGSEEWVGIWSLGSDGGAAIAAVVGASDAAIDAAAIAEITHAKAAAATDWFITAGGWSDERYATQGGDVEPETTAGVRKSMRVAQPATVGGSAGVRLTNTQLRTLLKSLT